MTNLQKRDYEYMGKKEIGIYTYYGYRMFPGTTWRISRKNNNDASDWAHCFGAGEFIAAWNDPSILSYGY